MGNLNFQHWLIGQGLALLILLAFGVAVKILLERKQEQSISRALYFGPLILGFIFAFIVQYFILFGGQ
jgi:hypothetical protein